MKKLKLFALLLITAVGFAACAKNEETPEDAAEDNKVLTIGVDDTFAPMGFLDENNELVGFDIDLATEAGKRMGYDVKFQTIDWSMKEAELNNKNIDLIWNGYTITDERKEQVNFTKPYMQNQQVILVMANSNMKNKADLADKVVAVQAESSAEAAVTAETAVSETFKDLVSFATYNECFLDLEAGRSNAVVADRVLVKYYISQKDDSKYVILDENFGDEEYGVGVRKEDTTLLDELNAALDAMKADGKAEEISAKWFGDNIVK